MIGSDCVDIKHEINLAGSTFSQSEQIAHSSLIPVMIREDGATSEAYGPSDKQTVISHPPTPLSSS